MTIKLTGKGLVVLGAFLLAATSGHPADAPFKVVVNPSVPGKSVPRDVLAKIYLGDAKLWGNGDPITAVDQSSTSSVREAFSARVLGMTVDAVRHHWLRRVSSSARSMPPKSRSTDEDVIAYVASERGSVGYVSASAALPPSVREVVVE